MSEYAWRSIMKIPSFSKDKWKFFPFPAMSYLLAIVAVIILSLMIYHIVLPGFYTKNIIFNEALKLISIVLNVILLIVLFIFIHFSEKRIKEIEVDSEMKIKEIRERMSRFSKNDESVEDWIKAQKEKEIKKDKGFKNGDKEKV